jgi:hypothetical protein
MKLAIIYDNETWQPGLEAAWGFSCLVEANGRRGEVCPSGWQPGKPTLKPGPQLVGKVYQIWKPE